MWGDHTTHIELLVCDMDGTLFQHVHLPGVGKVGPWSLLARSLGDTAYEAEKKVFQRWHAGEISSVIQWAEESYEVFRQHGLTQDLFQSVVDRFEYMPYVHEAFERIHEAGIRTAIVSGGFQGLAERALQDLGIHTAYTAADYLWDEAGNLTGASHQPTDYEGKVRLLHHLCADYRIETAKCAFVGDGKNDSAIAREVDWGGGTSIAFNAEKVLREVSTHSVKQKKGEEDWREVLQYIL